MTSINGDTVIMLDTPCDAPHHVTSASTNGRMTKQNVELQFSDIYAISVVKTWILSHLTTNYILQIIW